METRFCILKLNFFKWLDFYLSNVFLKVLSESYVLSKIEREHKVKNVVGVKGAYSRSFEIPKFTLSTWKNEIKDCTL